MSDWISVKDRLPDNATDVFVCTRGGYRSVRWWNESRHGWRPELEEGLEVTHWQPLPEPPKEEA
jgi:hypothetical protein